MRGNPVALLLAALGLIALATLPYAWVAPNRLVSGEPVYLLHLHGAGPAVLVALLLATLGTGLRWAPQWQRWQPYVHWALASALVTACVALAGQHAAQVAGPPISLLSASPADASVGSMSAPKLVRVSLGSAFWVVLVLAVLAGADAVRQLRRPSGLPFGLTLRLALQAMLVLPALALLGSGQGAHLSLMVEAANREDQLGGAVLRHLQIVLLALLPTLALGLPAGWYLQAHPRSRRALLAALNVVQTIPSIALFGLLMAPLAWLAMQVPALRQAGISGVGLAPAVIALVLYSLLPVVRSALAGFEQVSGAAMEAAQAMGMSRLQCLWSVELPLALPVLLSGIRTAAVQTMGLAAVTALIGTGGLGAMMFDGLFGGAHDVVLLAVLPLMALAAATDAGFALLVAAAHRHAGRQDSAADTPGISVSGKNEAGA